MHEIAIRRLDRAALALVQALDTYGDRLKPYLESQHLETLQSEVINLRRTLLGLEMGILYQDWDAPADLLESVVNSKPIPVEEAAAQVLDLLKHNQRGDDKT
jgi:hypothetical protein